MRTHANSQWGSCGVREDSAGVALGRAHFKFQTNGSSHHQTLEALELEELGTATEPDGNRNETDGKGAVQLARHMRDRAENWTCH